MRRAMSDPPSPRPDPLNVPCAVNDASAQSGSPYNARVIPIDTKPGPFDLRFRLFGTPVRVKVSFWIFMALFGYPTLQEGLGYLFVWIFCGFVSVLCHEMGHIVA